MKKLINFKDVSNEGLESSAVSATLAGLRANEARYFMNKYKSEFFTFQADDFSEICLQFQALLKSEKNLEIQSKILEFSINFVDNIAWIHFFYENGLALNLLYPFEDKNKRAVGIKLSDGMEIPEELNERFKFARQKSKLAGTIRGSYFKVKGEYDEMVQNWIDWSMK